MASILPEGFHSKSVTFCLRPATIVEDYLVMVAIIATVTAGIPPADAAGGCLKLPCLHIFFCFLFPLVFIGRGRCFSPCGQQALQRPYPRCLSRHLFRSPRRFSTVYRRVGITDAPEVYNLVPSATSRVSHLPSASVRSSNLKSTNLFSG